MEAWVYVQVLKLIVALVEVGDLLVTAVENVLGTIHKVLEGESFMDKVRFDAAAGGSRVQLAGSGPRCY